MARTTPVVLVTLAALTPAAIAHISAMPVGCRQWIELSANFIAADICCDDLGFVAEMPLPSPNYYTDPNAVAIGAVLTAYARSTPNRMESTFYTNNSQTVFFYNSMVDTFTITGPPGTEGTPVTATVSMHTSGVLRVESRGLNSYVGGSSILTEIGTWGYNYDASFNEQFRVERIDLLSMVDRIPFANYGPTPQSRNVDYTVSGPLTRTVGVPFELAFGLTFGGAGGSIVSLVNWSLPPGYTITSSRGWTDPTAPSCDSIDFNNNGVFPEDQDVSDFFSVVAGASCNTCNDIDFNNNGVFPEDQDLIDFFNVLAGGDC